MLCSRLLRSAWCSDHIRHWLLRSVTQSVILSILSHMLSLMIYALPIQGWRKLTDNWTPPPPLHPRPDPGMHIYFSSTHSGVLPQAPGHHPSSRGCNISNDETRPAWTKPYEKTYDAFTCSSNGLLFSTSKTVIMFTCATQEAWFFFFFDIAIVNQIASFQRRVLFNKSPHSIDKTVAALLMQLT